MEYSLATTRSAVVDGLETLCVLDALQLASSEAIHQVYVRRIKAEEVFAEKDAKGNYSFPCATGELSQPYSASKSFSRFQLKLITAEDDDQTAKAWLDAMMPEGDDDEDSFRKWRASFITR